MNLDPVKYWTPEGFEISSYRWGIGERKNSKYYTSGSDNTGKCLYEYNELGFRGESIHKEGFRVMSLGCSNTEGVGLNMADTWPHQVCRFISNSVNLNFGTGGRSNDFITRSLLSFFDLIKPDLVLIMYTIPSRKEYYTEDGGIEPYMTSSSWGYMKETKRGNIIQDCLTESQNTNEDIINWYKNHLLIKNFLENKKCNWLWNGSFLNYQYQEKNRFDGNYNVFIDKGVDNLHPGPIHNRTYSENLIRYIKSNFPSFVPDIVLEKNYKKII